MPTSSQRYLAALAGLSQFRCVIAASPSVLTHALTGVQVSAGSAEDAAPHACTLRLTFSGGHCVEVAARPYLELQLAEDAAHTLHSGGADGAGEIHARVARHWRLLARTHGLAG